MWNFEVKVRDTITNTMCSWSYQCSTFAEAEEAATKDLVKGQEIVQIEKDY